MNTQLCKYFYGTLFIMGEYNEY